MSDNWVCHHCPHKTFRDETEFEAHRLEHVSTQTSLRRRGRTYGARISSSTTDPATNVPTSGPILPFVSRDQAGRASSRPGGTGGHDKGPQAHPAFTLPGEAESDGIYNMLATFMAQDKSLLSFRRFSKLNLVVLLKMQTEIVELEKRSDLAKLSNSPDAVSISKTLAENLHQYNDALLRYSQLSELHKARNTSISDLRRYIMKVEKEDTPILRLFTADYADDADFVSLDRDPTPRGRMYSLVEHLTWRFFTTAATGGRKIELPQQGTLYTFDDGMIQMTFRALITMLTFVVLLTPIIVLSYMEEKRKMLVVIVVCTAVAATTLATATNCREHEIMVAAATYAAALLVYIED